ncbi:hypothetical protein C5B90_18970 [Haloferax sp. Atlit-12N]|uniref:hypothetical protein n=1 Tax=Haloferax sp. Atlit-12N TaxID=2077203 RepID=UPI000E22879A|nr:hypothetical protein [Haloferax sp. Atlit-12N]RDZ61358.1 hypothetical protein C5B90_18970 [Haloferax sp. Atlit-12N]
MTRSVHTDEKTVDVTQAGVIDGTELEIPKQEQVALRTTENDAVTGDPEIALQASIDGTNWMDVATATGLELEILKEVPDPKVRAAVTTTASAGTLTLWISAK